MDNQVTTPVRNQGFSPPVMQLNQNRSLLKFVLLGIITFGIYPIVFYSGISSDINVIAFKHDGKKTMHFCLLAFLVAPITLGIANIVWFHKLSGRIGNELRYRRLMYNFSASDFWLWNVIGSLIFVGPFVYINKLATASNILAQDYNIKG